MSARFETGGARTDPPAFVGPRPAPTSVVVITDPRPLCVRTSEERGENLTMHAQFWHDVAEREQLGGCQRCAYLETAPHRIEGGAPAPDPGTYTDEAGHAAVARGQWPADMVLTAREVAEQTSRGMRGGR